MVPSTIAGNEMLAYCTSCKMDLNHIVVAMKGAKVAKVQCFTCKKEHAYRAPKGISQPTPPKTAKSKKPHEVTSELSISIEAEWEKLMSAHPELPLQPYSIQGHFGLGDKIKHPSFGEGIVSKLIYPNKLEVIFRTDIKVLICNYHNVT